MFEKLSRIQIHLSTLPPLKLTALQKKNIFLSYCITLLSLNMFSSAVNRLCGVSHPSGNGVWTPYAYCTKTVELGWTWIRRKITHGRSTPMKSPGAEGLKIASVFVTSHADLSDYHWAAGGHVKRTVWRRRPIVNSSSTYMCEVEILKRCRVTIVFRATARGRSELNVRLWPRT